MSGQIDKTFMDPISGSCVNLSEPPWNHAKDLGSAFSVSRYENNTFKSLTPQIFAAIIATFFHVSIGISLAYSAILVPQLQQDQEFPVTKNEESWITSIIALITPVGCLFVGVLMDRFGRLKTLIFSAIPGIFGWVMIALSPNVAVLITGRALVGFATALGSNPAVVYLTEIGRKDMRGSLISLAPALTSLGMVLTFIMGWFLGWRQVAWITNIFILVSCVLLWFIPESPAWMVSKGRVQEAKKALLWIHKHQPDLVDLQLAILLKEHELKTLASGRKQKSHIRATIHQFMQPTAYKPLAILTGLFFFQQFSGIFIFLFYSITFFQEVGATANPYLASVFIGVVRFIMSMVNTYSLKTYGRRPLVFVSCFGMSICIGLSGFVSHLIKIGDTTLTWLPVMFLLLFVVASMVGVVSVPYTMSAELFPIEIRGVANSLTILIANLLMFVSLQLYHTLYQIFGGIVGLQYFFAAITLFSVIFVYLFMPETHEKKLSEIEEYFRNHILFVGSQKRDVRLHPISIVNNKLDNEESLLEQS